MSEGVSYKYNRRLSLSMRSLVVKEGNASACITEGTRVSPWPPCSVVPNGNVHHDECTSLTIANTCSKSMHVY